MSGVPSSEGPLCHTFYLLAGDGQLPSRDVVRQACEAAGGELIEEPFALSPMAGAPPPPGGAGNGAGGGGEPGASRGGAAGGAGGGSEVGIGRRLRRGKFGFAFGPQQFGRQHHAAAGGPRGPGAWGEAASFDSGHGLSF